MRLLFFPLWRERAKTRTSFHTDLTTQMPAIVAVKKNHVKPPYPAWTAIQVSRLIPTNGITEIKIVPKPRN
jgi:hypothetical protein